MNGHSQQKSTRKLNMSPCQSRKHSKEAKNDKEEEPPNTEKIKAGKEECFRPSAKL